MIIELNSYPEPKGEEIEIRYSEALFMGVPVAMIKRHGAWTNVIITGISGENNSQKMLKKLCSRVGFQKKISRMTADILTTFNFVFMDNQLGQIISDYENSNNKHE